MRLGPGLLFAGAAVGVSHLVQSTRAGAEFGLTLAPLLILACLVKYPMFRFGAEYSAVTGESVVTGYERQGRWVLVLFFVATVVEGVGVIPAVSLVTAGLAMNLFGVEASVVTVTGAIVVVVTALLAFGRYRMLEHIARVFVVIFSVLSVMAAAVAMTRLGGGQPVYAPFAVNEPNVFFAVAVAGWMPIGAGGAAFLSAWVIARSRSQGHPTEKSDTLFDFNLGYLTTVVIALCFLVMGTAMLFGSGTEVSQDAGGFSAQLVGLFAQSIGQWAQLVVAVAALAIMLSTVLASGDGFPRVYAAAMARLLGASDGRLSTDRLYLVFLGFQLVAALTLLGFFFESFAAFIDLVTTMGFFMAPVIAFLNHTIMFSNDIPTDRQPPRWLRQWSFWGGTILAAVCPIYLYFRFV